MVSSGVPAPEPSKLINRIIVGSFWMCRALGNILTGIVANSDFGKLPESRDMTIVWYHFLPHVTEKVIAYQ